MYIIYLLIILFFQIKKYLYIKSIFKIDNLKNYITDKINKKVIMILLYDSGDNIKECIESCDIECLPALLPTNTYLAKGLISSTNVG